MSATSHIQVPATGSVIEPGKPIPDDPIIPYIEGDGIGVDITPVMIRVIDAAVAKAYGARRRLSGWRSTPVKNRRRSMVPTNGCLPRPSTRSRSTADRKSVV